MKFKDYYETFGLPRTATQEDIKRSYRKLARKYHPDLSKDPEGESRFKELGEAYAVLKDPEKRAAYDRMGRDWKSGEEFQPPPDWEPGFEFDARDASPGNGADHSEFFETLFGHRARGARLRAQGEDRHARITVDLLDAFGGAERSISLRTPTLDAQGRMRTHERTLDVRIPKGVRAGQHLRLAGQGDPGLGGGAPGDLYLEIDFKPHPLFRVDERDIYVDLPLAPWEAALGCTLTLPTPDGSVQLTVPAAAAAGHPLRLKGRGIPGKPPGDLYAQPVIVVPPAITDGEKDAYHQLARAFHFDPRAHMQG